MFVTIFRFISSEPVTMVMEVENVPLIHVGDTRYILAVAGEGSWMSPRTYSDIVGIRRVRISVNDCETGIVGV